MSEKPANEDKNPRRFRSLAEIFLQNLEALRDLLLEIGPKVAELDASERAFGDRDRVLAGSSQDERYRLAKIVRSEADRTRKATARAERTRSPDQTDDSPGFFTVREFLIPVVEKVLDEFGDRRWAGPFVRQFVRAFTRPGRLPIFRESIVISAVSAFEILVGRVVAQIYSSKPEVLRHGGAEKEFSLEDLNEMDAIEDAVDLAVTRRVEAFLWKGLVDWDKWFSRLLGVGLSDLTLDWETTREVFERRHLLVHNAGRVSRRYLDAVPGAGGRVKIGDLLTVDEDYISRAIDHLTVLGVLLPFQTWVGLFKSEAEGASKELSRIVYDFVLSSRWSVVRALCLHGRAWDSDQGGQWVFQCNEWLARKRLEGVGVIEEEVRNWDTSGAAPKFRLVRWALLNDRGRALEEIPAALRSGDLTREDLYEWPILEEVREDDRFPEVVRGALPAEKPEGVSLKWVMAGSGRTFHRPGCRRRSESAKKVRRKEAFDKGLRPCRICEP